jgi:hypothetical protein
MRYISARAHTLEAKKSSADLQAPLNSQATLGAGNFTSDQDSSPEIHGQVQDVIHWDDGAGGPIRARTARRAN